jgi:DegV family protein with EDD domain
MNKRAVIATSTGSLDYVDFSHKDLRMLRMKIILNGEEFNDFVELSAEDFYTRLENDNKLVPTSSMPSPGEFYETLDSLVKEGYKEVIVIPISSKLSGSFDMLTQAAKTYEEDIEITVVDSKNAAISEGWLSMEALRLMDEGVSTKEIVEYLEFIRTNRKQYFMVDNLRLFVANGRLSGASGFVGSMLKIKPILEVNDEGAIVPFKKIRSQKRALKEMVELVIEDCKKLDKFVVTYNTSNNLEGLKYVMDRMEEEFPGYIHYATPITPVVGCHTGVGTVGIAYFDLSNNK